MDFVRTYKREEDLLSRVDARLVHSRRNNISLAKRYERPQRRNRRRDLDDVCFEKRRQII